MTSTLTKILTLIIASTISVMLFAPAAYGVTTDDLLPRPGEKGSSSYSVKNTEKYEELGEVANLPEVTDTALMTTVIKTILGWAMLLTIAGIIVASIYYLTSRGKEEGSPCRKTKRVCSCSDLTSIMRPKVLFS